MIVLRLSLLALLALPIAPALHAATPAAMVTPAAAQLRALYTAEWNWREQQFGRDEDDARPSDHFPRVDAATQAARLAYWQRTLDALNRISADQLSPEEKIDAAVFRTVLEAFVAQGRFRTWEMPFTADSQFWSGIEAHGGFHRADEYRRYLARLRDLPRYFGEQIVNMRAGLARGFSVPRATLVGRDASIVAYTGADPVRNPFYAPFAAPSPRRSLQPRRRRSRPRRGR